MKNNFALGLISGVLISLIAITLYNYHQPDKDAVLRLKEAQIARQELVIDSLMNPVDTGSFFADHSELKGD